MCLFIVYLYVLGKAAGSDAAVRMTWRIGKKKPDPIVASVSAS